MENQTFESSMMGTIIFLTIIALFAFILTRPKKEKK
jgi:preprotein translocase subunit YajC